MSVYFKGIKEKDRIWDLFLGRIMVVQSVDKKEYFPISLKSLSGNFIASCTMGGKDGIYPVKRYFWSKPKIK
jgi:hypothetical protein